MLHSLQMKSFQWKHYLRSREISFNGLMLTGTPTNPGRSTHPDMKTRGTTDLRAGLFIPTMRAQPPMHLQLAPQLATEGDALSPRGPS